MKKNNNPETFYNSDVLFSHALISDIPLLDSFLIWDTVAMKSPDALFHISKGDNTTHNGQYIPTFKCGLQKKEDKKASALPKLQDPAMAFKNPDIKLFLQ